MAVNLGTLGITAAAVVLVTAAHFVQVALPSGFCRRGLKSSEIFVKRLYTTESLLSDALSAKYKYIQSVVATRTRGQKRLAIFGSAMLMQVIGSYRAGDSSFIIVAVSMIFTISCIFLGIYLLKSSFKKESSGSTAYFNATEENWVTSSDLALFNSSNRIEIAINWSGEVFSQIVNGWVIVYVSAASIILNEGEGGRKKDKPGMVIIIFSAIAYCAEIESLVLFLWWKRRTVSVVEVQFAQAVSEKDADDLQFDVGKLVRKFANDAAKGCGKKWTASAGAYYDFAIAGEHGGLVYGRMRAGGLPANV
ncbi:hypothetical protein V1522DRAFT_437672 [Lipomyces starkeyi]